MCLHFEISSVLLLRMLFPLNNAISSFSFRQKLHLSDERLKHEHFLRILHFIWGTEYLRIRLQLIKTLVIVIRAHVVKVYDNYAPTFIIYKFVNYYYYLLFICHKKYDISNQPN